MEYIKRPMDIEKRSMEIIEEELGDKLKDIPEEILPVVKRAIHTTADFDFAEIIDYSDDFIKGVEAGLKAGSPLITDTTMSLSGINKRVLKSLGVDYHCLISDPEVVEKAKIDGTTRSMAAVRVTFQRFEKPIFVIGNAPTALFQLKELIDKENLRPAAIIGVPVGFVGARESKEEIRKVDLPYLVTRGRKGGSTVAASIVNALLYQMASNITP